MIKNFKMFPSGDEAYDDVIEVKVEIDEPPPPKPKLSSIRRNVKTATRQR